MAKAARTMRTRMMNSPRSEINWRCKGTLCKLGGLACMGFNSGCPYNASSQPATRSAMVNDDDVRRRRRHLERRFSNRTYTRTYILLRLPSFREPKPRESKGRLADAHIGSATAAATAAAERRAPMPHLNRSP